MDKIDRRVLTEFSRRVRAIKREVVLLRENLDSVGLGSKKFYALSVAIALELTESDRDTPVAKLILLNGYRNELSRSCGALSFNAATALGTHEPQDGFDPSLDILEFERDERGGADNKSAVGEEN